MKTTKQMQKSSYDSNQCARLHFECVINWKPAKQSNQPRHPIQSKQLSLRTGKQYIFAGPWPRACKTLSTTFTIHMEDPCYLWIMGCAPFIPHGGPEGQEFVGSKRLSHLPEDSTLFIKPYNIKNSVRTIGPIARAQTTTMSFAYGEHWFVGFRV